ncbi:hypothetical protein [Pelagibacterium montanilacus]|uniref:hypothetical protein n=1 Tax=Pelagibacterium montanilacus TaxID=2185280 RepID=UPI000F8E5C0E|nr:hypothetical protein [Pelagibacterium montanilacus]
MTPVDPADRQPKGDHNRRLSLGMEVDDFAAEAGLTPEEVYNYEMTSVDYEFDLEVARKYGEALDRLEAHPPATQRVRN